MRWIIYGVLALGAGFLLWPSLLRAGRHISRELFGSLEDLDSSTPRVLTDEESSNLTESSVTMTASETGLTSVESGTTESHPPNRVKRRTHRVAEERGED